MSDISLVIADNRALKTMNFALKMMNFVIADALLANFWLYCVVWMAIIPYYFDFKIDPDSGTVICPGTLLTLVHRSCRML